MDIFQCINKKKSNVHCQYKRCKHNYDGICIHEDVMNKYKDSAYALISECDIAYEENCNYDDMYWY